MYIAKNISLVQDTMTRNVLASVLDWYEGLVLCLMSLGGVRRLLAVHSFFVNYNCRYKTFLNLKFSPTLNRSLYCHSLRL